MRTWKVQLYRRAIPAIIQGHKFEMAEQMANNVLKLLRPKDLINEIIIRNYRARIYYEKFFCKDGGIELLKMAKKTHEEAEMLEAGIPEYNKSRILNNESGYVSLALGEYAEAVRELRQKLLRDKKEKNLFGEIATAVATANTYQLLKDYKAADEFALRALKLARITRQGKWLFAGHHILANVYHDAGNIDYSIREGEKCTALSASIENITESMIQLWITTADCYKVKKDDNKAIIFIEAAIKAGAKGYHLMRAEVISGEIYYYKQDYKIARQHFDSAKKLLEKMPPEIAKKFSDIIVKFTTDIDEPTLKKLSNIF